MLTGVVTEGVRAIMSHTQRSFYASPSKGRLCYDGSKQKDEHCQSLLQLVLCFVQIEKETQLQEGSTLLNC